MQKKCFRFILDSFLLVWAESTTQTSTASAVLSAPSQWQYQQAPLGAVLSSVAGNFTITKVKKNINRHKTRKTSWTTTLRPQLLQRCNDTTCCCYSSNFAQQSTNICAFPRLMCVQKYSSSKYNQRSSSVGSCHRSRRRGLTQSAEHPPLINIKNSQTPGLK